MFKYKEKDIDIEKIKRQNSQKTTKDLDHEWEAEKERMQKIKANEV